MDGFFFLGVALTLAWLFLRLLPEHETWTPDPPYYKEAQEAEAA